MSTRILYATAIFLSAFLLFQIQPLIGKYIMPWFGTTPGVWVACLVFFQLVLLGGYGYAHVIASRFSTWMQVRLHLGLLVAALLVLPIIPSPEWKAAGDFDPTMQILLLLTATVGLPYLLLAATSPLLQKWFFDGRTGSSPYRLYAVSNAGSLLALVSYPLFFERFLKLQAQAILWSGGFLVFVLWVVVIARRFSRDGLARPAEQRAEAEEAEPMRWKRKALWFSLAATGSVMLVATTNRMSQDVPAIPFLFVLPLGLFLATFIIAFDSPRWYFRPVACVLMAIGIAAACMELRQDVALELYHRIAIYAVALFTCCLCCHGELARLKPSPHHLTAFYLILALGGAFGGVMVALVAPRVFSGMWEYEIGLAASFGLVMFLVSRDLLRVSHRAEESGRKKESKKQRKRRNRNRPAKGSFLTPRFARMVGVGASLGFAGLIGFLGYNISRDHEDLVEAERNFYGVVRVVEPDRGNPRSHRRKLYHGSIIHGMQMQDRVVRNAKISYYGAKAGIGVALSYHPKRGLSDYDFRIGVVGLGAGAIALFANDPATGFPGGENDYLQFYEINPLMVRYSEEYFSYLRDARGRGAEVNVSLGDARIVMERQLGEGRPQNFDVLAIDAFSGDSIPMHLLTKECIQVYLRHLRPDGILALHLSNRYLDLSLVAEALAEEHGLQLHLVHQEGDSHGGTGSLWALMTNSGMFSRQEIVQARRIPLDAEPGVLWTDDFSSLFDVVK